MTKVFRSQAELDAYLKSHAYRERTGSGWLRVETFWEKLGRWLWGPDPRP